MNLRIISRGVVKNCTSNVLYLWWFVNRTYVVNLNMVWQSCQERCSGLMISRMDAGLSSLGLNIGWGHCHVLRQDVPLDTLPLSTLKCNGYKWSIKETRDTPKLWKKKLTKMADPERKFAMFFHVLSISWWMSLSFVLFGAGKGAGIFYYGCLCKMSEEIWKKADHTCRVI